MPARDQTSSLLARQHIQYEDPFAKFAQYANQKGAQIRADEKYAAEQARQKMLDDRATAEYDRQQKEREAKELFYRELQAGPQTTYRDMDTVVKSLGLADPTMTPENMSVYDIDGKKYSTPTIAAGQQPLTEAQVAQRTAKQLELGGLLDKSENKVVETQPAMFERVLSSLTDKGYDTAAFTEPLLQARATEKQADKEALAAAEKQVLELETARRKNTADFYNALPKADIKELGTQSRTSVSSNKEAITNDYKKMSEAKKAGKLSLEDFDKWATETFENSLSGMPWRTDRDDKRDLIKYMYDNEISPNLAKDWLIANRQTGDLDSLDAIKVNIKENSDRFKTTDGEGYVGGDTSATNTDAETRRLFGAVDPYGSVDALKAYHKTSDNELTARIKAAQDKVAQLKLSPEQREASRQAQYEKDIGELLKGVVPTMAAEEKQQTAVTSTSKEDGRVPVKVLAAAGGSNGKGNGTPVTESSKRKKNEPVTKVAKAWDLDTKSAKVITGLLDVSSNDSSSTVKGNSVEGIKLNKNALTDEEAMLLGGFAGVAAMPAGAVAGRIGLPVIMSLAKKLKDSGLTDKVVDKIINPIKNAVISRYYRGKSSPVSFQPQSLLPRYPGQINVPRGGFNNPNVTNVREPLMK